MRLRKHTSTAWGQGRNQEEQMNDPSSVKKSIEEETREISIISKLVSFTIEMC